MECSYIVNILRIENSYIRNILIFQIFLYSKYYYIWNIPIFEIFLYSKYSYNRSILIFEIFLFSKYSYIRNIPIFEIILYSKYSYIRNILIFDIFIYSKYSHNLNIPIFELFPYSKGSYIWLFLYSKYPYIRNILIFHIFFLWKIMAFFLEILKQFPTTHIILADLKFVLMTKNYREVLELQLQTTFDIILIYVILFGDMSTSTRISSFSKTNKHSLSVVFNEIYI